MKVCILGLGHVGLTLSLALAKHGVEVFGVDSNKQIVSNLQSLNSSICEQNVNTLLKKHLESNFFVSEKIPDENFDVYILCVGTPIDKNNSPVIEDVKKSSELIGLNLKKAQLVIIRSTVPVGTTRSVIIPILEQKSGLESGKDFDVAYASERTIEGKAISEIETIPQIIGGISEKSINLASDFFKNLTPLVVPVSSLEAAEMIKLIDNTYRDVHFAYANEIAMACEMLNLDAVECISKANYEYPRNNIPMPSPGVGGPCIGKDSYILAHVAEQFGYKPNLITHSRQLNEFIPVYLATKIVKMLENEKKDFANTKIFIIGFAFKGNPETDDTRNSSTLILLNELKKRVSSIYGFDPVVKESEIKKMGAVPTSIEKGFENADCVVIMNNHKSYLSLALKKLFTTVRKPCLFVDSWYMFKEIANEKDIIYTGIGTVFKKNS